MARKSGRPPEGPQDRPGWRRGWQPGQNSQQNQYRHAGMRAGTVGLRLSPGLISTLFLLLIILEIAGFIWVADHIGLGLTLLAVLASAFLGLWVIKRTGLDMIAKLRLTLGQGQEPGHSLVDGACFVIAGLLLILPGFFSDILAGLLMLPVTRNWFIRRLARQFGPGFGGAGGTTVIEDAEFHEVRDTTSQPGSQPRTDTAAPSEPTEAGHQGEDRPATETPTVIEVLPPAGTSQGHGTHGHGTHGHGPHGQQGHAGTGGRPRPVIDVDDEGDDRKSRDGNSGDRNSDDRKGDGRKGDDDRKD